MFNNTKVTFYLCRKWLRESLRIAQLQNFDKKILDSLEKKIQFVIIKHDFPPFGRTEYEKCEIKISGECLMLKEKPVIFAKFKDWGLSEDKLVLLRRFLAGLPPEIIFDIFNQSVVDHNLLHHCFFRNGRNDSDNAANDFMIRFACYRGLKDQNWKAYSEIISGLSKERVDLKNMEVTK